MHLIFTKTINTIALQKKFRIQRGEGLDNISLIFNQHSRQEQTQQKEE